MPALRPIYVFDHVRSYSQLFNRVFAAHPQLEQVFMPLIGASLYGPEAIFRGRRHSKITDQAFHSLAEPSGAAESEYYSVAVERIEATVAAILEKVVIRSLREVDHVLTYWQGKIPWLKDHAFCTIPRNVQDMWTSGRPLSDEIQRNPTVLPSQFLDGVTPVFLIRHPALSIPSFFRKNITICRNQADDEDFAIYSALFWSRLVFDSFIVRAGGRLPADSEQVPIVLDAADVIYNSEAILQRLCQRLRIDASGVQFSWAPTPQEEQPGDPVMRSFFDALYQSSGLERRSQRATEDSMDLDAMQQSWSEECGSKSAQILRGLVDTELQHYEYLMKFKLRA